MNEIPGSIGTDTTLDLTVKDAKSGLRSIHVAIIQNKQEKEIFHTEYPRQGYMGQAGPAEVKEKQVVDLKNLV